MTDITEKIWKKPADAAHSDCPHSGSRCYPSRCGAWLPRPCPACKGEGYTVERVENTHGMITNSLTQECSHCNGTGHDGSGLGRCGLVRV